MACDRCGSEDIEKGLNFESCRSCGRYTLLMWMDMRTGRMYFRPRHEREEQLEFNFEEEE